MASTTNKTLATMALLAATLLLAVACSINYSFTGTNINYDVIKTIQIDKITNRAPYGWAPMEAMFNNKLQDKYANSTRLRLVKRNGDLQVAGEITAYDQFNKAISADGYSSQVQLKMTVNIRFRNNKANQQWEKQFSATTQYDARQSLATVQEGLVDEMITDIVDQVFNATVADW